MVQPSSATLYSYFLNPSSAREFRLVNTGNSALNIKAVTITSPFRIIANGCVGTLAVGHACSVNVNFRATHAYLISGTLSFSDSAANSPQTASLRGVGVFLFQGF
jgi:hypothetical protein